MANELEITDEFILKDTIRKARIIIAEERQADIDKEVRDKAKARLKLLYEEYSNGNKFDEFEKEFRNGVDKIKTVSSHIDNSVNTQNDNDNSKFVYPIKGTWAERIIAVFKYKNRVLKITDVVEIIKPHEPEYNNKQLVNLISNTVNMALVKKGFLKIYDPPFKTKGFYYGSPLWWDENGELKKEHINEIKLKNVW